MIQHQTHLLATYQAPGPVAKAFLEDTRHQVRLLRGPVGSGKTIACCYDAVRSAIMRMPIWRDGVIRYRQAVIGSTYGQLERNLYPSWWKLYPKDPSTWTEGEWQGGGGRFAKHVMRFTTLRGGRRVPVEFEAIFAAIGEQSIEEFVRGFEPSGWHLYEVDQQPEGIIEQALGRLGRYPNRADIGAGELPWEGTLIGDLNAPDINHWYDIYVNQHRPPFVAEYVQPSGLSPDAENVAALGPGYYEKKMLQYASQPRLARRFVLNEYGPSGDGEPVFPQWSDARHLGAQRLQAVPGREVLLGFDQGLHPACVIGQRMPSGQMRILGEVLPGRCGTARFCDLVRDELRQVAPESVVGGAWCDPAGFTGAEAESGERSWAEMVAADLGFPLLPASDSNALPPRLEAVIYELTTSTHMGEANLLLSSRCKELRRALASEYRFAKRRPGESQATKPIANRYKDIADALQYLLLGEVGQHQVMSGRRDRATRQPASSASSFVLPPPAVF